MRQLLITLFILCSTLSAADIAGSWYMERTLDNGRKIEVYYVFKADGDKFTGHMVSNGEQRKIVNGVVDGNEITFEGEYWLPGRPSTAYRGELNGDELTIVVDRPQGRRQPRPVTVHRTSPSSEFNPPNSLAATHDPLPPFEPLPPNGLAMTPPMGWNSWNKFHGSITDQIVREIADAMVESGMRDAGYVYVNIDDTWEGGRDENGNMLTNEKFPDMKALGDYIHSKGLKFGIYSGPGRLTCAGFEASYGHEEQDAKTFAEWGVDYLKYDWCGAMATYTPEEMPGAYRKMALALRATGRPMVYSICEYGWLDVGVWGPAAGGNLWRTTGDIGDRWESMERIGFSQDGREKYARPGHWNDPDMLEVGNGGMTATEYRTHMSLWAMLAAPLLAGNDLREMTPETIEILTNPEVIAVDQDKLGRQGYRVKQDGELEIWMKPLSEGTAIALFNRGDAPARMTARWSHLGLRENPKVRDLWAHQDLNAPEEYSGEVPSHGVVLLRVQ